MHYRLIFLFFIPNIFFAQAPEVDWQIEIVDTEPWLNTITKEVFEVDNEGNIYVGGQAEYINDNLTADDSDAALYKYSARGELLWKKQFGSDTFDILENIVITKEGTMLAVGASASCDDLTDEVCLGEAEAWIIVLDSNGEILSTKILSGSQGDILERVISLSDGSIMVSGFTQSTDGFFATNTGNKRYFTAKFDPEFELDWIQFQDGATRSIAESLSDGVISVGVIETCPDLQCLNGWITKRSKESGEIIFEFKFEGNDFDAPSKIMVDGNYIFIGMESRSDNSIFANNKGADDIYIIKMNLNGEIIWVKNFGGAGRDSFESFSFDLSNQNLYISGNTFSNDGDILQDLYFFDSWLFKVNKNDGELIWSKILDVNERVSQTNHRFGSDGSIYLKSLGYNPISSPLEATILTKLFPEKNTSAIDEFDFVVAPNPIDYSDPILIYSDDLIGRDLEFELVDITGRVIQSTKDLIFSSNPMNLSTDFKLHPGLYYIHLSTRDINISKPVVVIE